MSDEKKPPARLSVSTRALAARKELVLLRRTLLELGPNQLSEVLRAYRSKNAPKASSGRSAQHVRAHAARQQLLLLRRILMELPPAEAAVLLVFRDEEDEVERAHDLPMLPPDTIALMLCTHVSNVGIQIIELYETIEPERRDALVDALEDRWNSEPREGRLTIRWPGTEESVVHEKILEPHS